MVKECTSCGASSNQVRIDASWTCEFCKSVNFDEKYVDAYLSRIDIAKLSNYMRMAKTSYEAGNFKDAVVRFDQALEENAQNPEAWAYKGLALAHTINLSNIDSIPDEVDLCFQQANALEPDGNEFLGAAREIARERVISELMRSTIREYEQAQKTEFAFSDDVDEIRLRVTERYNNAFHALAMCLSKPSSNVRQMIDVCRLTVAISQEKYAPSSLTVTRDALNYVDETRRRLPSLMFDMPKSSVKKAACFPSGARVASIFGSWISMSDLRVGQLVLAYDVKDHNWEPVSIIRIRQHAPVRIVELLLDSGQILATTASHSVLTKRGWVPAGRLRANDTCLLTQPGLPTEWHTVTCLGRTSREEKVYSFTTSRVHVTCVDGVIVHEFTHMRALRSLFYTLLFGTIDRINAVQNNIRKVIGSFPGMA